MLIQVSLQPGRTCYIKLSSISAALLEPAHRRALDIPQPQISPRTALRRSRQSLALRLLAGSR